MYHKKYKTALKIGSRMLKFFIKDYYKIKKKWLVISVKVLRHKA